MRRLLTRWVVELLAVVHAPVTSLPVPALLVAPVGVAAPAARVALLVAVAVLAPKRFLALWFANFAIWHCVVAYLLGLQITLLKLRVGLSVRYCCYILCVLMLFVITCVAAIYLCCIHTTHVVCGRLALAFLD